jgi:hypothetical protein
LLAEAERREAALARYNQARMAHGQIPEVDDPELSHLQAVWLKLRSVLSTPDSEDSLTASLAELDQVLQQTVTAAQALHPADDIASAMAHLIAEHRCG